MNELYCNRCAKRLPENHMVLITKMYCTFGREPFWMDSEKALCDECQESFLDWYLQEHTQVDD